MSDKNQPQEQYNFSGTFQNATGKHVGDIIHGDPEIRKLLKRGVPDMYEEFIQKKTKPTAPEKVQSKSSSPKESKSSKRLPSKKNAEREARRTSPKKGRDKEEEEEEEHGMALELDKSLKLKESLEIIVLNQGKIIQII